MSTIQMPCIGCSMLVSDYEMICDECFGILPRVLGDEFLTLVNRRAFKYIYQIPEFVNITNRIHYHVIRFKQDMLSQTRFEGI